MRGTPSVELATAYITRLIPTYAGNTRTPCLPTSRQTAHPHVCGEHEVDVIIVFLKGGSSPRMRGTLTSWYSEDRRGRLIPTYAGNTRTPRSMPGVTSAHPHVCGEHHIYPSQVVTGQGSSPRMRGTPHLGRNPARRSRLIPTYAGNTLFYIFPPYSEEAHPHVCGEHSSATITSPLIFGSSPRMRGTRRGRCGRGVLLRLIPTYAGNTRPGKPCPSPKTAHPHVCGEHERSDRSPNQYGGSSPRMRGTRPYILYTRLKFRLIPTYAGNTRREVVPMPRSAAHPHVCGEHYSEAGEAAPHLGSSPRMRGTP